MSSPATASSIGDANGPLPPTRGQNRSAQRRCSRRNGNPTNKTVHGTKTVKQALSDFAHLLTRLFPALRPWGTFERWWTALSSVYLQIMAFALYCSRKLRARWTSPGWRMVLRYIGLNTLALLGYPGQERPIVVLERSRWKAAAQCTVHIVPVLAEVVIIWVNTNGVLFGSATPLKLAMMQVGAKVIVSQQDVVRRR